MMKILVTGTAGFIGSHLAEALLKQGHDVVGFDNLNAFYDPKIKISNLESVCKTAEDSGRQFDFIEADLCDVSAVENVFDQFSLDSIIHLAAMAGVRPSMENPELYLKVNLDGTLNLLKTADKHQVRKFVFASSSSVYGNNQKVPFSEKDSVDHPISHYAATKKAGELLCHVYHKVYGFDVACLRFFTVYGPRQRPDLAIHKFLNLMKEGKDIPIYGDGTKSRDFTYISDIVDGVIKSWDWVCSNSGYEIFNLGESKTITVNEMIETIEKCSGFQANRQYQDNMPGDVEKTFADVSKAKAMLGYNPQTKFETGIQKFVDWFKSK